MNHLTESVNHIITRLPKALPVVVIEAIPSDLSLVSTKILESGWSILVCGRRLFAWNYSQTSSIVKTCYELQLPASDISHKADLVCLLLPNDRNLNSNLIPAVLAVSPEGTIRFWPKIANSNNSIEVIAHELQGQECNSLVNLKPYGCILSTTTNTLMQVNINYGGTSLNDSNMITCRLLKMPQGVFAGFKKFSSFIFGGTNSQFNFDKNYLVKVLQGRRYANHSEIIVFTGNTMQVFEIGYNSDKLITELDLDRLLKEGVLRMVLINGATQIDQLNLWIIDAKYKSNDEIVLIFACFIKNVSIYMNYVLATLTPESLSSSQTSINSTSGSKYFVKSMNLLRNYTSPVENDQPDHSFLDLHLVKETAYPQLHYIYDRNKVICVQEGNDVVDTISFNNSENEILGIGVCEQQPLIFTSKDSLITLTPNEELISLNSSTNLQTTEADVNESDKYYWLKKAFQTYRKKDLQLSQQLIKDNFLGDLTLDFELDKNVVTMSEELIDSAANSDPRWAEQSQNVNYNVVSVLISNQIEEKYRNFLDLIGFLKHCGIWQKLSVVTSDSRTVQTKLILCEHGEKLVAANALKKLEEEFFEQIDHVIRQIVERRNITMNSNLTNHDYFYRQVSAVYQFFPSLYAYEEDCLNSNNLNSKEMLEFIVSCSLILITVFQDISYFRKNQTCFQDAILESKNYPEYNLWTNTGGQKGIRSTLLKQIDLLISYGIESKFKPGTISIDEDIRVRTMLYQKLIDITDIVLEGYQYQMQIVKPESDRFKVIRKDFENDRSRCIKPLIKVKQYERAMSLAEKYEDFDTLISICEIMNNNDRLNKYRIEFQDKGFAEYLFKWYMAQGKQSKMLINSSPFLGKFLENHENLYWLYAIQNNQFDKAGDCLLTLAQNEDKILDRKKTLYSLSKLSFLANGVRDTDEIIEKINKEHEIIAFQEVLPPHLLPKDNRPLNPVEMIEILTDAENDELTEIDFKHALDLTTYIKDNVQRHENLKRHVIVHAILRDKWNSFNKEDPMTYIYTTLFFKLVKHSFLTNCDITFSIPECDQLLSWSEFDVLENRNSFIYLIKVLYESIINKFMQEVNVH